MGVPFRIVLYAADEVTAEAAAFAAFQRISELNDILSDYDTDSELSRLSQTGGSGQRVPLSMDLWRVLERAQKFAQETDGAFDVTAGPAVSLWRKARRVKQLPAPDKIAEALRGVGHRKLVLDPRNRTAQLLTNYMRLDCGAIAKGYAVDEALKVLRARGVRSALVAGSGDMAVSEPPPGQRGWRIELASLEASNAPPREFVLLRNQALATSGDLFQHVEIEGTRYSHIIDPRTGIGLTDRSLVVVIAPDCMTADALSTAVSVLGPLEGIPYATAQGACVRVVRRPAQSVEVAESACFRRFVEPRRSRR
jgi:FAD:protein FMN transferase